MVWFGETRESVSALRVERSRVRTCEGGKGEVDGVNG